MTAQSQSAAVPLADEYALADRIFEDYRLDAHIPGMVYGVVNDGRLVHVKGAAACRTSRRSGRSRADTLFRIASMTKAFTALSILKLRDDGKLRSTRRPRPTSRRCGR